MTLLVSIDIKCHTSAKSDEKVVLPTESIPFPPSVVNAINNCGHGHAP